MSKFDHSTAYLNKNPLNIRYSNTVRWQGQTGAFKGFVKFTEFCMGYRAAVKILHTYHLRGIRSIRDIISTWAPPTENMTDSYIKTVLDYMNGVGRPEPTEPEYCARTQINLCDREEVVNLLMAMTRVEMGANAAQLNLLKSHAEWGYDKVATAPGFFKSVTH